MQTKKLTENDSVCATGNITVVLAAYNYRSRGSYLSCKFRSDGSRGRACWKGISRE